MTEPLILNLDAVVHYRLAINPDGLANAGLERSPPPERNSRAARLAPAPPQTSAWREHTWTPGTPWTSPGATTTGVESEQPRRGERSRATGRYVQRLTPGHDGIKGIVASMRNRFRISGTPLEDVMADDDKTAVRFTCHGTHRGVYPGGGWNRPTTKCLQRNRNLARRGG